MASIMALDSVLSKSIPRTDTSPMLLTFGQPRTGNDIFSNEVMKNIPIVYRVVREGDLIPNLPPCSISHLFLDNECSTVLPDGKFDPNYVIPDKTTHEVEKKEFYKWHIGGLIHYNADETEFVNCGNEYGENNKQDGCKIKSTLNYNLHRYFGTHQPNMCLENILY
jgi:hypothetical protein